MVNKRKKSATRRKASTSGAKPNIVIKHPGRVRDYMKRKYGKKAFQPDGDLKMSYLNQAEKSTNNKSLRESLGLAKVFERWANRRK
jgi:hypothetical protein